MYPYTYGDEGPAETFITDSNTAKVIAISVVALLCAPAQASAAENVTLVVGKELLKRASLESARSAACAATGACLMIATNGAKCGRPDIVVAALCGACAATCVDATIKLTMLMD